MTTFGKWITRCSTVCAMVAAVLLLAAIGVLTWMVLVRSLGYQNSWELETSIEMMVIAIFLGAPYTLHTGGHVKMEILEAVLPESARHAVRFVAQSTGLAVCVYLAWSGLQMTMDAYRAGERALGVWQPLVWPKYASVPLGMGLTALQYLAEMRWPVVRRRAPAAALPTPTLEKSHD